MENAVGQGGEKDEGNQGDNLLGRGIEINPEVLEPYGSWMLVAKKSRFVDRKKDFHGGGNSGSAIRDNRGHMQSGRKTHGKAEVTREDGNAEDQNRFNQLGLLVDQELGLDQMVLGVDVEVGAEA